MTLLYNAGIAAYRASARLAALRSRKVALMLDGQGEAIDRLRELRATVAPAGFDLWVHAASLGEFEQGRPLMERYRREHPGAKILLSFFSPSGYEVRKNYAVADAVVYLPFDTRANAKAFIDAASPACAVFVKYEFWGNYISELKKRGVPTYIISAIFRRQQVFFKPWGGDFREILRSYTHIYVQDENSRQLLSGIGVGNVTVAGDTRFDRVTDILAASKPLPDVESFCAGSEFTLIAGSSWPQDEDVYIDWLHRHPEVKAICAPHEFDAKRLESLCTRLGEGAMLYSRYCAEKPDPGTVRYLIVDCFGLLSSLYRFADVALIGGGFGAGIHNINEAAVYGVPVVFGPKHQKFKEASDLMACSGGFCMTDAASGHGILERLLADKPFRSKCGEAAGSYIKRNLGATERIYSDIFTGKHT